MAFVKPTSAATCYLADLVLRPSLRPAAGAARPTKPSQAQPSTFKAALRGVRRRLTLTEPQEVRGEEICFRTLSPLGERNPGVHDPAGGRFKNGIPFQLVAPRHEWESLALKNPSSRSGRRQLYQLMT